MMSEMISRDILPLWAVLAMLSLTIPSIAESAISSKKGNMPKMVVWILQFSLKLEKAMTQ